MTGMFAHYSLVAKSNREKGLVVQGCWNHSNPKSFTSLKRTGPSSFKICASLQQYTLIVHKTNGDLVEMIYLQLLKGHREKQQMK